MRVAVACAAAAVVAAVAATALVGGTSVGAAPAHARIESVLGCGADAQTVLPLAGRALTATDLGGTAVPEGVTWTTPSCTVVPAMSAALVAAPTSAASASLAGSPVSAASASLNWAGYHAARVGAVSSITAQWVVPSPGRTPGTRTTYSSAWVGIGGFVRTTLVQAGSESDATCASLILVCAKRGTSVYLWFEIYPDEYIVKITNLHVSIGDRVSSTVSYSRGVATFVVCNQTQRRCANIKQRPSVAPSADVEWIAERPTVNGQLPQLADFGRVTFNRPTFVVGRTTRAANAGGTIDMYSCRRVRMAHTNGYSTRSASFSVDWTAYGNYGC